MPVNPYPFLISVPHGGTDVPGPVRPLLLLTDAEIRHFCDHDTRRIFDLRDRVAAWIDTPVSRMIIDLNRPPLPLPPKNPDGVIKTRTIDGREVYRPGMVPDLQLIHRLMVEHYFPFHQRVDELIDHHGIRIAFDCHAMLPRGSVHQKDAGRNRPLICLGNNGDRHGRARKGGITTCSPAWITLLADIFEDVFSPEGGVAINTPFAGGFIANAHYWRKAVPWIQIEINRALYEPAVSPGGPGDACMPVPELREKIWQVLAAFWDTVSE